MPRKRAGRLYQRAGGRWYADLRDLGGGREAMKPVGESYATTDRDVAMQYCTARVRELEDTRRTRQMFGVVRQCSVGQFATEWIQYKRNTETRHQTLDRYELAFEHAFKVLDDSRNMDGITLRDAKEIMAGLRGIQSRYGKGLSSSSVRHVLVAMSQMFDHAEALGVVPAGHNPWKRLPKSERPRLKHSETDFLEVLEAAALIHACESVKTRFIPLRTLVSTLLLTGGRLSEVLGLEWSDVNFDRDTVTFRDSRWRDLKRGPLRTVPLWPELRDELSAYRLRTSRIAGLVFPGEAPLGEEKRIFGQVYKQIAKAARLAKIDKKVTPQVFRVTYCAARLQTTDHGAHVSPFTVMKEMGHASLDMIERVYGRIGTDRHRSDVVEFKLARASTREGLPIGPNKPLAV